jgi:Tol biopolymer transport system component
MTPHDDDFEARLTSWLRGDAPAEEPAGLLRAVVARTAATRRRPRFAIVTGWLPWKSPVQGVRYTSRAAWLPVILVLLLAIAAGILAVGSIRHLPAPVGPARSGLIAFDSAGDIIVMKPDGSDRRNVTGSSTLETSPSFSPDGTKIAYWSRLAAGSPASLRVMNADGSDQHDVSGSTNFSGSENLQPVWSPDSRQLAFAVGDYYSSTQLYVVRADGTDTHKVGEGSLSRSDPAWSPDGRLIAFRGHTIGLLSDAYPADPAIGVYVIAPDGTGERKVSQSVGSGGGPNFWGFGGPGVGTAPSWSPDGRTVLYATGSPGHHALAIGAVEGSSERVIDLPAGDHLLPAFSPDGSVIAFEDLAPAGDQATAFVVNTDGSGLRALDGGAPVALNPLSWSPDGRSVVTYSVDLAELHLSAASQDKADMTAIPLGDQSAGGFPERASWQRLAP